MNATHEGQDSADIIERTAAIIEQRGKATGEYEDFCGRVCVVGGLRAAVGLAPSIRYMDGCPIAPVERAYDIIDDFVAEPNSSVMEWSDRNSATEVIGTLRAIALIERAKSATLRAQQAAPVAEMVTA